MGNYGDGLYGAGVYETPVTAVLQNVWPPRVLVTITGLVFYTASTVTMLREVAAVRTVMRGFLAVAPGGNDAIVRVDAEQPFGIPVRYVAAITKTNGSLLEVGSAPITTTITQVALSDAINGNASQTVIVAWPDKTSSREFSTFNVGGRSVVVSGPRGMFTGNIDLVTATDAARENLDNVIKNATSGVLQLRQQGGYGGVDSYIAVLSDTETRWSQDGSDQRRRWTLSVQQVDGWPPAFETQGFTLQNIDDQQYGTLAALHAAFPTTLLAIAQADFS